MLLSIQLPHRILSIATPEKKNQPQKPRHFPSVNINNLPISPRRREITSTIKTIPSIEKKSLEALQKLTV